MDEVITLQFVRAISKQPSITFPEPTEEKARLYTFPTGFQLLEE